MNLHNTGAAQLGSVVGGTVAGRFAETIVLFALQHLNNTTQTWATQCWICPAVLNPKNRQQIQTFHIWTQQMFDD